MAKVLPVAQKKPSHWQLSEGSRIKKTYCVMSAKGGVGKSTATSLLGAALCELGKKVAILDADITGPSIARMFGVRSASIRQEDDKFLPARVSPNLHIMSLNALLDQENQPVLWRSPIIVGTIRDFYTQVKWGEVDVLLIDMPPGTGDIPLSILQSVPLDGVIFVSTPQALVSMVVQKSIAMVKKFPVPIVGLVENMSYFTCPHCQQKTNVFGQRAAGELGLRVLSSLPIDPELSEAADTGQILEYVRKNPIEVNL